MLSLGMLVYPIITAGLLGQYSTGDRALAGYLIVAAFCACYLLEAVTVTEHPWFHRCLLGAMTALFVAELPFAREFAFFLAAVTVSLATIFFQRYAVPVVAAGTLAPLVVPPLVPSWHSGPATFEALAVLFTALTVHAFAQTAATNLALVEARAEVARLASEAERNRIARDLHDLLGHSLTVITVKSALARRLAAAGSSRALDEITAVEELGRQALADVRAAVTGYREVNLAGELARGRELLRAAGIVADLPTATDMVDAEHRELFGWVVREGLTNVVRHANASRCTITLSAEHVEIRDDGVGAVPRAAGPAAPAGRPARVGGNGLTGLRERVAAAGGSVEAGPADPGGWRLRVSLAGMGMTSA
ncbi:sensor histidine kinase [Streptomyces sp. PLK6-54]|uniref:Sensor histidine kinase n=2 Tax=Actinacidiphila acidipaludis TaxID=2873382 RepID=A0ABS7Q2D2_9ACTN|nr:sensor histidine kinase [Streptomyces acidipaludis]